MKTLKKTLSIILLISIMALMFASCGAEENKKTTESTQKSADGTAQQPEPNKTDEKVVNTTKGTEATGSTAPIGSSDTAVFSGNETIPSGTGMAIAEIKGPDADGRYTYRDISFEALGLKLEAGTATFVPENGANGEAINFSYARGSLEDFDEAEIFDKITSPLPDIIDKSFDKSNIKYEKSTLPVVGIDYVHVTVNVDILGKEAHTHNFWIAVNDEIITIAANTINGDFEDALMAVINSIKIVEY